MKRYMAWSIVLFMLLSLTAVFAKDQQKKEGKLKGKNIVMIIAQQKFSETEFKESKDIFEREEQMSLLHPAHCQWQQVEA